MTALEAALKVLQDAGTPLHYREITQRAVDQSWLSTEGATPWASMNAQITTALNILELRLCLGDALLKNFDLVELTGFAFPAGRQGAILLL